jgi:hypothetical protein
MRVPFNEQTNILANRRKENTRFVKTSLSQKISANYIKIEEEYGLSSDHSGVILTLSKTIIRKEANPTLVNKTNWEGFKEVTSTIIKTPGDNRTAR